MVVCAGNNVTDLEPVPVGGSHDGNDNVQSSQDEVPSDYYDLEGDYSWRGANKYVYIFIYFMT